jgi:hypothetical protein
MIAMPVDKKSEKKPKNQIEIASPIKPATSTTTARAMSEPINGYQKQKFKRSEPFQSVIRTPWSGFEQVFRGCRTMHVRLI